MVPYASLETETPSPGKLGLEMSSQGSDPLKRAKKFQSSDFKEESGDLGWISYPLSSVPIRSLITALEETSAEKGGIYSCPLPSMCNPIFIKAKAGGWRRELRRNNKSRCDPSIFPLMPKEA